VTRYSLNASVCPLRFPAATHIKWRDVIPKTIIPNIISKNSIGEIPEGLIP
jgi:hypothetical protein